MHPNVEMDVEITVLHKQLVKNQQSGIYVYTRTLCKQNKNKTTSPTLNGTLNLIKDSGRLLGTSQNCFSRTLQSHKRSHKGGKYCNTNRVCTSTLIPAPFQTFSLVPTIGFFLKTLPLKAFNECWLPCPCPTYSCFLAHVVGGKP